MGDVEASRPIVMVVDDNPSIRDMVSWALQIEGYQVFTAADGHEALAWIDDAAREGRYPSVILLDVSMPGMNGRTFLQQLRTRSVKDHPPPSIIIITAGTEKLDIDGEGIAQVVMKPFRVRDLLAVVRKLAK